MAKKKFIKCACSTSSLSKPTKSQVKNFRKGPEWNFRKCECRVDSKRLSKHGIDNTQVEVEVTPRKGFETDV